MVQLLKNNQFFDKRELLSFLGKWNSIAKQMTLIGQLGLSFLMPLLICLGICFLLTSKLGLGEWVYIPGFLFGLGSSFMTAYKFYVSESHKADKNTDKKTVSFNSHQ